MKIAIGSDHRGFTLKEDLKEYLKKLGFVYKDLVLFRKRAQIIQIRQLRSPLKFLRGNMIEAYSFVLLALE